MADLKIGSKLQSGKYEITKVLGSGNFGITYLASTKIAVKGQMGQMDVTINVAIKEFYMKDLNNRTSDGTTVEGTQNTMVKNYRHKFRKEAENLSKLHHPNIVKVIEVFDENNTTYYVMEYIEGGSLDDYIKAKGHLPEKDALECTLEIGNALSYMHKSRMIHLDLKPKNIMRDKKGHLYLIDFGLSKQYDENGEPESSTSIGLGTPGYAPLEQANYKQDGTLPVTLDVYALGASLFKMLTGKTPPESSTLLNDGFPVTVLQQIGVSADTISIVEKAMSPMKKERYQNVSSLVEAISNISDDNEHTSYQKDEEGTTYDGYAVDVDNSLISNSINDEIEVNNVISQKRKVGGVRIALIVGLGIAILLLLCTISNMPLEIRNIVGYRTGDAEDFLIKNWNIGIIGLCLSLLLLTYYLFSKKKIAEYASVVTIVLSLSFLIYFINSEKYSTSENNSVVPSPYETENQCQFLYSDGTVSTEIEKNDSHEVVGVVFSNSTTEKDRNCGWKKGYALALKNVSRGNGIQWCKEKYTYAGVGPDNLDLALSTGLDGLSNSKYIMSLKDFESPAVLSATNYMKEKSISGCSEWYLPSLGQIDLICKRLGKVSLSKVPYGASFDTLRSSNANKCIYEMNKIFKQLEEKGYDVDTIKQEDRFWSSSIHINIHAYMLRFYKNGQMSVYSNMGGYGANVRPVIAF